MNAYIWQSASNVTDSYHSHGGLVVVAASLDRAREIIAQPFCEGFWPHGDGLAHPENSWLGMML